MGYRSSFLWKSLLSSIELLIEGLVWRLGNGNSIKIWKHRWLPTPSSFPIQSPVTILDKGAIVQGLIEPSTGDWNHYLINQIFNPLEAKLIRSLPLSLANVADKLI